MSKELREEINKLPNNIKEQLGNNKNCMDYLKLINYVKTPQFAKKVGDEVIRRDMNNLALKSNFKINQEI